MTNQLASLEQRDYFYLDPFSSVNLGTYIIKSFTRQNSPDSKVFEFKVLTLIFRIQNLWRHGQTGEFLFRIRPLVCKRQNQSGTKTFRTLNESGTISSSVNLLLNSPLIRGTQRVISVYICSEWARIFEYLNSDFRRALRFWTYF